MKPTDYLGTPYAKMDCFALVRAVALNCYGITYPALVEHSPHPKAVVHEALRDDPHWREVDYADRRPGDVMTLSPVPGSAGHVGVVIEHNYVLHNDKKYGAIIQDDAALRRRGFLHRRIYRWVP